MTTLTSSSNSRTGFRRSFRLPSTRTKLLTALLSVVAASTAQAQVFQPLPFQAVEYQGIFAGHPEQIAFDPLTGDYAGARMQRRDGGGNFFFDMLLRPDFGFPGPTSNWYPMLTDVFTKTSNFDIVDVVPSANRVITVLNNKEEETGLSSGWIVSRRRNIVWQPEYVQRLNVGPSNASIELLDATTDGTQTYILGTMQTNTFGTRPFWSAIDSEGVLLFTRLLFVPGGVRFDGILAHAGSIYLSGADGNGGFPSPPVVARFNQTGGFLAGVRYDNMWAPWLGKQPSLLANDNTLFPQLVTMNNELNTTVVPLLASTCQPAFGLGRTLDVYPVESAFMRDAVLTDGSDLHILYGTGLDSEYTTDTHVLVTGSNFADGPAQGIPARIYSLDEIASPRGSFLLDAGAVAAVGGTGPQNGTEPGYLQLVHSDPNGLQYPCSFIRQGFPFTFQNVTTSGKPVASVPITTSLTPAGLLGFGTMPYLGEDGICD